MAKKKEEEDKKKKIHDVTYRGNKTSITFPEGKGVPLSLQDSERTTTTTEEEWERKKTLSPQERLKESTDKETLKTTETQIPKETQIPQETQPRKDTQPKKEKSILDKVAEWGVTPAVFTANLIAGGVEAISGYDMGRITSEEFAGTGVGKALGLGTVAAAATLGGVLLGKAIGVGIAAKGGATTATGAGQIATTTTNINTGRSILQLKAITALQGSIPASKVNLLFQAAKNVQPFVLKSLLSKGAMIKIGAGVGAVSATSGIMTWMASDNIMQGTSIMTRDLSYAVKSGAVTKEQALTMLDEAQGWKNRAERFVKINSKVNPILWPFGKILLTNAKVAQQQLDIQRQNIIMAGF